MQHTSVHGPRIDGASHVALYDEDQYVTPAITKLAEFFRTNLVTS